MAPEPRLTAVAAALVASLSAGPVGNAPPEPSARAIYHADPDHLWNRLYEALFVRTGPDGLEYGRDRIEPLLWRSSKHLLQGASHHRLLQVLDEFHRADGARLVADPLKRAMLQRDLWLVFSWLESSHDNFYGFGATPYLWEAAQERLQVPLARAIGRVALTSSEIARLPDTYALAVASGTFAARDDPRAPDRPYLPSDLFAREGPWVSVGRGDELVAPMHVLQDNPFTTSAFLVFISLPAGRAATLDYVERLRAFDRPLLVKGTEEDEGRGFAYVPNPSLPQFPVGTRVALVRRALLIDATHAIVPSTLTENVQVRVYRIVPPPSRQAFEDSRRVEQTFITRFHAAQSSHEFVVSRERLFGGRTGGLAAVVRDETDFRTGFSTHGTDFFELDQPAAAWSSMLHRSRPLDSCHSCHGDPGVYSFNTFFPFRFTGVSRPPTPPPARFSAVPVPAALAAAAKWKESRPDWLTLKRLLAE